HFVLDRFENLGVHCRQGPLHLLRYRHESSAIRLRSRPSIIEKYRSLTVTALSSPAAAPCRVTPAGSTAPGHGSVTTFIGRLRAAARNAGEKYRSLTVT